MRKKEVSSSRDIANFSLLNCIVCNEEKSSDQDDAGRLNMIRLESIVIELPNKNGHKANPAVRGFGARRLLNGFTRGGCCCQ